MTLCLRGHSKISVLAIRKDPTVTNLYIQRYHYYQVLSLHLTIDGKNLNHTEGNSPKAVNKCPMTKIVNS